MFRNSIKRGFTFNFENTVIKSPSSLVNNSPFSMGIVWGKIGVETPKYEVLDKGENFEVRKYSPVIAAEVSYEGERQKGENSTFMILASYIGALSSPKNIKPNASSGEGEKIAMTSPVITAESTSEKIAMTAPVITNENNRQSTMQFILPSKYTMDTIPKPTDPRVTLKEIGEKKYGVISFNGSATPSAVENQANHLKAALEKQGHKIIGDYLLAQYNPPFTIPYFRKNEVMFPVE